jgi:beta-N-acetylhexosaminidase
MDTEVKDLALDIGAGKIGGVILFSIDAEKKKGLSAIDKHNLLKSRNIVTVDQVKKLNKFLSLAARNKGRPPLLISLDQEGGWVTRLKPEHGFDLSIPTAKDMEQMFETEVSEGIEKIYINLGLQLAALGFNLNFAPCVDVDVNPLSPAIGKFSRAFSTDPKKVSTYGMAAAKGLWLAGVLSSFKHFPGHGSATDDTHQGKADVTTSWKDYELQPYEKVPLSTMVMVGHLFNAKIDAVYPASLSEKTIKGVLRKRLNFDGVVISDDLQMGAIYQNANLKEILRQAINAGNDILLLGNNKYYTKNLGRRAHREILKMIKNGEISRTRIQESFERIIKLKAMIAGKTIS